MELITLIFALSIIVLVSLILTTVVSILKINALNDVPLEHLKQTNFRDPKNLMFAMEHLRLRHHKQMLMLHISLLVFVLIIGSFWHWG